MWFLLSIISGITLALSNLGTRSYSKKNTDSWILSFYFSFIGSIILFPFFIWEFNIPFITGAWILMAIICLTLVLNNLVAMSSFKYLGASTVTVVGKLKMMWILIASIIFLNELVTINKIIGILLIIASSLIIVDFKTWKTTKKGIMLVLISTITATIFSLILKLLTTNFGIFSLTFFIFFITALLNSVIMPNFFTRAKKATANIKIISLIGILGTIANIALVAAMSKGNLSNVYFVFEAALIFVIVGEYFFLKERNRLALKVIALTLAIVGATLLRI